MPYIADKGADWSKAVKKALVDRSMKNYELADKVGYSHEHLSRVLNGLKPSSRMQERVNDFLGIPY